MKTNEVNGWLVRKGVYTYGNYVVTEHRHGALRLRAYDLRVGGLWVGRFATLTGAQKSAERRQRRLELA